MNSMYDYLMQQFQGGLNGMKFPEFKPQVQPVQIKQDDEQKNMLARITEMNNKRRGGQGGILDALGLAGQGDQFGRAGGFIDQYNKGQGIFSLLG